MTITAVANTTTASTNNAAASGAASANTALDRQAFLKLLVAQLKYQDPSKPMDASAMISQSAQLSVVDKLDEISKQLTTSGTSEQLMLAGYVVGRRVSFIAPDGTAVSDTVKSARLVGGSVVVRVGNLDVPVSAITSIEPAATPTV